MSSFPNYNSFETFWHKSFYKLNDWYARIEKPKTRFTKPTLSAQESSDLIFNLLESETPCMVARYGSTELYCISNYLGIQEGWRNAFGFIKGEKEPWWWAPERVSNMQNFSGFFPLTEESILKFCSLMLEDSKQLDILASWLPKENNLEAYIQDKTKIFLPYLEPWYASHPWTRALKGKRIVVVHPFASQISSQYAKHRTDLFEKEDILPDFDLRIVKAVQSLGGNNSYGFTSWFDALEWMKQQLDNQDYDIALIGCGAYGFPLAAHAKRSGKKAIHMGGALQLLFGIKGNRWEDPMYGVREWGLPENYYPRMFNEYWEKPGDETKPANAQQVEGACYW